jgi:hypothetical protein
MDLARFVNPHFRKLVVASPGHASTPIRVVRRGQQTKNSRSKGAEKQTMDPVATNQNMDE